MQIKTDRELLENYATDHNDAGFAELVARYSPMVYRACLRVLGNASDAEDATQAAFLVLARKAGSLRQEGRLNGWLHRVARQVALRVRADRERRQEEVAVSQERMTMDASEADTEAVLKAVDAELDGLSAILREAVVLRYLRGFSEQEAAAQAGCAVSAMKWRASDGIAKLRARLAKRGVTLSGVALAGVLASEASAAIPETLLPSILAAVKGAAATAATTTAGMLAKGAMKAMFIAQVKTAALVTAAAIAVGGAGVTAVVAVAKDQAKPAAQSKADVAAATNTPAAQTRTDPAAVIITPRTWNALEAFEELYRKGGLQVATFGGRLERNRRFVTTGGGWLMVPAELRFVPVDGKKLVGAVAASRGLKTTWLQENRAAVLCAGATDVEVDRLRKDIESSETTVRREAVRRAGWVWDVRVAPLLVRAAKDADAETARQAIASLRRLGWQGAWLLEGKGVLDLLAADLNSENSAVRAEAFCAMSFAANDEQATAAFRRAFDDRDATVRRTAAGELTRVGTSEAAWALIEKALRDQDDYVRAPAAEALGQIGGEKALGLLEKVLGDNNYVVRRYAAKALGGAGGDKALALIEKARGDRDPLVRENAVAALGDVGGDKAWALIEQAFASSAAGDRRGATMAMGRIGGEKALKFLEEALKDKDVSVRCSAASVLGRVGGEKAVALLEKAYDQDVAVRISVARAAGYAGGATALALMEKALGDKDADVRFGVLDVAAFFSREARDLLLARLAVEKDAHLIKYIASVLKANYPGDPAVEKALKDVKLPEPPNL